MKMHESSEKMWAGETEKQREKKEFKLCFNNNSATDRNYTRFNYYHFFHFWRSKQ